jgi:hypothetical protein
MTNVMDVGRDIMRIWEKGGTVDELLIRYYAVADLHYDDVDVIVLTPGGGELTARRKRIRRGQRTEISWRVRIEKREPGWPTARTYRDLPPRVAEAITRWRPISRATFPGPLPATPARIEKDVAWQSPAEPPAPPEEQDPLDWPGEYSAAPNISEREAEVRVLRGLRTMRSRHAVVRDGPGRQLDSVLTNLLRQLGKLDYEYVDEPHIAPAGVAWQPNRRDHGD